MPRENTSDLAIISFDVKTVDPDRSKVIASGDK